LAARPMGVRAVETITASGMRPSCRNEKGRRLAGPFLVCDRSTGYCKAGYRKAGYRRAPRPLIKEPTGWKT
jgi:hypothetical protein